MWMKMHVVHGNIFHDFVINSEAFASELIKTLEEMSQVQFLNLPITTKEQIKYTILILFSYEMSIHSIPFNSIRLYSSMNIIESNGSRH